MPSTARRVVPLLAALACVACQPASRADTQAAPAGGVADAAPSSSTTGDAPRQRPADTVILGEATYRERIKMPPGASLQVELLRIDSATPLVLARVRKPDVAGPPIPFALPYDAARVDAAHRHALRAELVGPDGERWMATPAPVPLVPGSGQSVELMLRMARAPAPGTGAAIANDGPAHWECGELGLMARPAKDALRLDANGHHWTLPRAPAASGVRHADAAGNAFHSKGATATLVLAGEPARDCVPAREASPWNAALLRGVAFRAVGNEPGWFVELARGEAPRLRAKLDYGERELVVERMAPRGAGFEGRAGEVPVRLDIRREPCTDGMSGQRFEAGVSLRVGERAYTGCGAFLEP